MLFFGILNPKIHSIKPSKCYKICNTAIVHSHFLERTVARLYNILLIYLFSLSSSLSPTSLSFFGSLSISHISLISSLPLSLSLISSLPHNKIICLRSAWWRGERHDGMRSAWRRSMWRLACCVFSCGSCGRCLVVLVAVFCGSCYDICDSLVRSICHYFM